MLTSSGSRSSRSSSSRSGKDMASGIGNWESGIDFPFEDLLTLQDAAASIVYERESAQQEFITILRSRDRSVARSPWKVATCDSGTSGLLVSSRRRRDVLHWTWRLRDHHQGRVGSVLRR